MFSATRLMRPPLRVRHGGQDVCANVDLPPGAMDIDTGLSNAETMLLLILASCVSHAFATDTRFVNFFPMHRAEFIRIRDSACADLFARKQAGEPNTCHPLLNCILEQTSEAIKGDISGAVIALGLMPSILTLLGSNTAELALLARRRPFLALLLACGSPSVSPLRTFVYPSPVEDLKGRKGRLAPIYFSPVQAACVSIVQYALVAGAVANVYLAAFYAGR
ncbi:uncharacterized protein DSM5745_01150 [Aspergillus mulundensis]|uniref:Uncharacterized protein n=1 Tax=Aspergillus mulundensis TaxID=1810919 RepID=A0A3D8T739_9EURO|nr:hypothetical protein DSM5745_01150 [Aspergillus mulundensis]RDW93828.1 hypothetical protein DSM5745_01150 [Aspergillus mulundensis]